jgi:hypothetical protein
VFFLITHTWAQLHFFPRTGLLLEIKEVNEQKRREDENILAFASGSRRPLIPDYVFDLPEPSVHHDLYNIIKFAADETLSEEQSVKVLAFWTSFIEPFFGVNPRVLEDSLEVAGKGKSAPEAKLTITDGRTGKPAEKERAGAQASKPALPSSPGNEQQEPTLAGLAAGATHTLTANADAAAASTGGEANASGPVSGPAAASSAPSEAAVPSTGPQPMEEDEKVKGGVSVEKEGPGNEEVLRVRPEVTAEKVAVPAAGPSAQVNGVLAELARKEELEATPSGDEERADQAGAAGACSTFPSSVWGSSVCGNPCWWLVVCLKYFLGHVRLFACGLPCPGGWKCILLQYERL